MNEPTQDQPAFRTSASQPPIINAMRSASGARAITLLGWIATVTAVVMYVSYISQIHLNLAGHKGSVVQPLATTLNCSLWWLMACSNRLETGRWHWRTPLV